MSFFCRPLALLIPLLLAACVSPHPKFFGATERRVVIEGREFAVFRKDDKAEIIRLGYAGQDQRRDIPDQMIAAVEQATGCKVRPGSIEGDTGEARVRLSCSKG